MSKPYPWFYAVNDRPVAIVETKSGGTDCLVFDFASGNLAPDRAYFSEVAPGSGKDVDSLTQAEFANLVAARRVDVLRMWASRMCRGEDMLSLASQNPPPVGAAEIRVTTSSIDLVFPTNIIAKVELEHRFGTSGNDGTYGVTEPGANNRCTLSATFGEGSWVKTILLRADRT